MKTSHRYAIAPNGIFNTVQGEGAMLGRSMTFVRLAWCSVGCPGCDTDYSVAERLTVAEIVERTQRLPRLRWVWLTGGEPTDQPVGDLVEALAGEGFSVALATSGCRSVTKDGWVVGDGIDFLSVSPHWNPASDEWRLRKGSQLNVVHGLNGADVREFGGIDPDDWGSMWATPFWYKPADRMEKVRECLSFVGDNPKWRIGIQAHKFWGVA